MSGAVYKRMNDMKYWIVDAFTTQAFAGNPAAVILVEEFPMKARCLQIAAEFNLSETAFVKTLGGNHFHIRWFTPCVEADLCGHATLASAYVLLHDKKINSEAPITFESRSGPLRVSVEGDGLSLNFPLQPVSKTLDPSAFSEALSLKLLSAAQAGTDLILELEGETTLRHFQPDFARIADLDYRAVLLTAQSSGQPYDFISRFFGPKIGIPEDPVTGSAHCKLASYWQARLGKSSFYAYQASARGGEMKVEIQGDRVLLKGSAVLTAKGQLM